MNQKSKHRKDVIPESQSKALASRESRISKVSTRILVFGTFDMIHAGHRNFFKQARSLAKNPQLIVSVARDKNVARIKGRAPRNSEQQRLAQVGCVPEVDRVVLGGVRHHLPHIVRLKPDIIALGYDQRAYVAGLRRDLAAAGLTPKVVRLKAYQPDKYKTSLIRK
jgi:FAD synthetase